MQTTLPWLFAALFPPPGGFEEMQACPACREMQTTLPAVADPLFAALFPPPGGV